MSASADARLQQGIRAFFMDMLDGYVVKGAKAERLALLSWRQV